MHYADPRDANYIASANQSHAAALSADFTHLGTQLARRGIDIDAVTRAVANFKVAIPSWGVGTGGTRFGRFPGLGEPRNVFEKLEDCAVIHKLTGATPTVSLHIPWDKTDDYKGLREHGAALGLGFDAMNSNTFQDQPG
jgi:L-rhamnose isomerase/sugar isomerase